MSSRNLAGRYLLVERLATGGMGTVFIATDDRLHRQVAVKLLKDELAAQPQFVERFRREARSAAALSHPNIASVFDYGEDGGDYFIVMEYVKGRDLARVIREEGPLSQERSADIVAQAADALAHAHAAGLIHRDVKPANIIVADDGRVKVTDFGIARASGDSTLTATGAMLGTANYISPEQASGGSVTPASDLYSLGVVLYEALTGSLPFTGESPIAIAMRHVSDPVPAPRELRSELSPEVDRIVDRATRKDPRERYPDTRDLADALRALPSGDRVGTRAAASGPGATAAMSPGGTEQLDPTVWPIPGDRWNPQRVGRMVLVGFAVLVTVAAGLLIWRLTQGEPAGGPAARQDTNPSGATTSTTAGEETTTSLASVQMPPLVGSNVTDAENDLEEMGYPVERVDVPSAEERDTVVGTDPEAGAALEPGQTITLFVSTGEPEDDEDEGPGPPGGEPPGQQKKEDD